LDAIYGEDGEQEDADAIVDFVQLTSEEENRMLPVVAWFRGIDDPRTCYLLWWCLVGDVMVHVLDSEGHTKFCLSYLIADMMARPFSPTMEIGGANQPGVTPWWLWLFERVGVEDAVPWNIPIGRMPLTIRVPLESMMHAGDFMCHVQNVETMHWTFSAHVHHREWVAALEERREYFLDALLRATVDRLRDTDSNMEEDDAIRIVGIACEAFNHEEAVEERVRLALAHTQGWKTQDWVALPSKEHYFALGE